MEIIIISFNENAHVYEHICNSRSAMLGQCDKQFSCACVELLETIFDATIKCIEKVISATLTHTRGPGQMKIDP